MVTTTCVDCKEKESVKRFNVMWTFCEDCLRKTYPHLFFTEEGRK